MASLTPCGVVRLNVFYGTHLARFLRYRRDNCRSVVAILTLSPRCAWADTLVGDIRPGLDAGFADRRRDIGMAATRPLGLYEFYRRLTKSLSKSYGL
jgi:hypothetical protein